MKKVLLALSCTVVAISTTVHADNCDDVKAQIAEKIKANGVAEFTLEAIEKGTSTDKKVVGVCGGGTKDIVYQRGSSPTATNQTSTEQNTPSDSQETEQTPTATE